jgi:hypothetical protein
MKRAAALALVASALACSTADAATVTSTLTSEAQEIALAAAPGERNRVELTWVEGVGVRLHDAAGLTALAPCVAQDAQTVTCALRGSPRLLADLGDGDDVLTSTLTAPVEARGGDGSDTLDVENGAVLGGPGRDVLRADTIDYSDHTAGVVIDLRGGPGGEDLVRPGASQVNGGSGDDRIVAAGDSLGVDAGAGDDVIDGSPRFDLIFPGPGDDLVRAHGGDDEVVDDRGGEDRLDGGAGDDHLDGGAGDDVVTGGTGRDALIGDAGHDRLGARDGERDVVTCTEQRLEDDRATVDPEDEIRACRHVARSGRPRLEVHALLRRGTDRVEALLSCPRGANPRACAGTLDVGRVRGRVVLAPGRRARVSVKVAPLGSYRVTVRLRSGLRTRARLAVTRP